MIPELINKIYVINLKSCYDRKKHIEEEFKRLKINNYEIFEATDKDSLQVKEMMKTDFVKKFPPCFRCNKNKCGCSNNVLIKHQIGNWCSFINVMNNIIKNDYKDLIMICEDDIKFTNNGMDILDKMITKDNLEKYNISFEKPILIRAEQRGEFPPLNKLKLTKKITMSNACFIINKFYAESFINNLKVIDRTSDMYLQKKLLQYDKNIQHFTIEPSPVYQLSDNKNAIFKSEIHPKCLNKEDQIRAKNHFKKVNIDKFNIITKYYYNIVGIRKSGNHIISFNLASKINKLLYYNDININMKFNNLTPLKGKKNIDKKIINKISDKKIVDAVIIGIEDTQLDNIKKFSCIYYSNYFYNILIIRNFFDVIISRMLLNQKRTSKLTLVDDNFCNLYYEYCLEYLGITSKLDNKININYDLIFDIFNNEHYENINKSLTNNFSYNNYYSGFGRNTTKTNFEYKVKKLNNSNLRLLKQIINKNERIIKINYKIYPKEYLDGKISVINSFNTI